MKTVITVPRQRSPKRRWITAVLIAALLILIPVSVLLTLRARLENESAQTFTRSLRSMLERQIISVDSTLDTIALELYQFSSDIHLIDVGLTAQKDDDTDAALACHTLNHAASLNDFVFSLYLVCKRNNTIYNSTDYQAYASDQFFDQGWVSQYSPKSTGIQLLDSVRVISTPSRQNKRLISFLSKVPNQSSLDYKYLLINVDLDTLGNSLVTDEPMDDGSLPASGLSLLIYNGRGEQLYAQRNALTTLTADALFAEDSGRAILPGAKKITAGGTDYLAVSASSSQENWTFVQLMPWSGVTAYRDSLLLYAFVPFAFFYLLLFAGAITMYMILARRQRARAKALSDRAGSSPLPEEPYPEYLYRVALEEHSRSEEMSQLLQQSRPVLTEYAVKSLLYNETAAASVTDLRKALMREYGILEEPSRIYAVMLAQVEAISVLKMNLHRDTYNQLRHTIEFGCREQIPEYCEAYFVWHNYSRLCCLLSFPDSIEKEALSALLTEIAHNVQNLIALLSKEPAIVGFGEPTAALDEVNVSYEQARQLIHHKSYRKTDVPYTYAEMAQSEMDMTYDQQKNLIDQIRLGKTEKALRILDSYFAALSANPEAQPDYVKKICVRLAGDISTALGGWTPDGREKGEDGAAPDYAARIGETTTIAEAADLMTAYVSDCADHMASLSEDRQSARFQEVLTWIGNHYNEDISLSDAASVLGLSPSYVSRMLKQATGDSFVSYLNKIRIERAKELLVTTELSSNEISSAVGYRYPQNFIRNFQKYAGMTPGNYRALHRDEQS